MQQGQLYSINLCPSPKIEEALNRKLSHILRQVKWTHVPTGLSTNIVHAYFSGQEVIIRHTIPCCVRVCIFKAYVYTTGYFFLTWLRIYDHVFTFTLLLRGCPNTNKMLFVTKSNLPKTGREEKCCLPKKLSQQSKWQQLRVKWYLVISFIIYDQNESKGHHTMQTYVPGQLHNFLSIFSQIIELK